MNIKQAKQEIANTLRAYLAKDEGGHYIFPPVRQRPVLLMGPPGIGKTAIMEQIARENSVALVAYTMTHHTRQSAIGLPHISEESYGGSAYTVTKYTLSEIIASVYESMERTGYKEGILFLDEINCVSETLAPTMLQFLQNKTFGNHRLPDGWLIVAAGNPPEYNKSVREFDIVTLDRVRQLDVIADPDVFLEYAAVRSLHGAVTSYLSIKPESFYHVKRTEDELSFVTARGWEDLSRIILSYEQLGIDIHPELVGEYLRQEDISRDFYSYYRLYTKYGADYAVAEILGGTADSALYVEKVAMAQKGDFTEKLTVTNLVREHLRYLLGRYMELDRLTADVHAALKGYFEGAESSFGAFIEARRNAFKTKKQFDLLSFEEERKMNELLGVLDNYSVEVLSEHLYEKEAVKDKLRELFGALKTRREDIITRTADALHRAFGFITDSFGEGQELTLLVRGLTQSEWAMEYISRHGCPDYIEYSGRLMHRVNERALREECEENR